MPPLAALSTFKGLPAIHLRTHDGAQATALLHGGHVVSWRPAGQAEKLYLSDRALFSAGQAVRGGIPVIFPQFECRGPLQRHGFARTQAWQLAVAETSPHDAMAVLRLIDNEETRQHWPHGFEIELTVKIGGDHLDIELAVNNTGALAFGFTGALHTYLHVNDIDAVKVLGLQGQKYTNSAAGQRLDIDMTPALTVNAEIDRIYHNVCTPITLEEPGRHMRIESQGFPDAVVWNPGPEKCSRLRDMPADAWRSMLCIEAGVIERHVMLAPGQGWIGRQLLTAWASDRNESTKSA